MLENMKSFDWWISVVIVGIALEIISHFAFKYINRWIERRSVRSKAKYEEKLKKERQVVKYYSSDFNLLVVRKLWGINMHIIIILVLGVCNLLVSYAIIAGIKSISGNSIVLLIFSGIFLILFFYILRKNNLELNRILLASNHYIDVNTLARYFPGKWQLTFSKDQIGKNEFVEIKDGNHYYANNELKFTIMNLRVNIDSNQIIFEKHNKHGLYSTETLKIETERRLSGSGTTGFKLEYVRVD